MGVGLFYGSKSMPLCGYSIGIEREPCGERESIVCGPVSMTVNHT